jgi:hypothetical protein
LLGALAVLVLLAIPAAVVVSRMGRGPIGIAEGIVASPTPTAVPLPFGVLDLCDDEQAVQVLDGGELDAERQRLGMDCSSPESSRPRYTFDVFECESHDSRLFAANERDKAIREFEEVCR